MPPSRARRQLAARLALHSQQKADAEASSSKDSRDSSGDIAGDDDHEGIDEDLQSWDKEDVSHDQQEKTSPLDTNPHSPLAGGNAREEEKKRPGGRQLDLDDFANSPAADADDTASNDSGEDFEMRVTMG